MFKYNSTTIFKEDTINKTFEQYSGKQLPSDILKYCLTYLEKRDIIEQVYPGKYKYII